MKSVKNNVARLITLNARTEKGEIESFNLVPAGKPVKVSDAALQTRFAKALIKSGDISVVGAGAENDDAGEDESDNQDGADLEDLRSEAEALGIEVDGRWGEKRLRTEIDKALKA